MLPERIGKYPVIRRIASGGMAEVYLCRVMGDEGFEKKIAVKVMRPRLSEDRHFRDLFIREARIAATLVHPNLIQVFDFGKERDSHFLAMEFIDGWDLAQAMSQARLRSIPFPLAIWRYWMEGILAGIGHLHSRGIVHRDISPSNVLLSRGGVVKITDFGIARATCSGDEGKTGWEGKFAYMSPEQVRGEEANAESDLFAAAVISAEFFLRKRLLEEGSAEKTLSRLREYDARALNLGGLPPAVAQTVRKGLATAREDRYADADEFSRAIGSAVPFSARRVELESFWNALFPDGAGEEDTVSAALLPGKGSDIVRESREGYGNGGRRLVKIAILGALAATSIGGWAAWKKGVPPASPPAAPPIPAAAPRGEPRPLPPAAHRNGEPGGTPFPAGRSSTVDPQAEPRARAPETHSKTVLIETDPHGVFVSLEDGTPLGRTPVRVDIAPWTGRKILFHRDGYGGKSVPADVLAQFTTFRLELERQLGTIEVIQAIPWAKVFDGDRYLGVTPIHNLSLPVGRHRLRFVNEPLAMEKVQEINVHAGANPKLIVSLVDRIPTD
jgi:tRNA A-37 threonylcarbamoyl transferase component Bud32